MGLFWSLPSTSDGEEDSQIESSPSKECNDDESENEPLFQFEAVVALMGVMRLSHKYTCAGDAMDALQAAVQLDLRTIDTSSNKREAPHTALMVRHESPQDEAAFHYRFGYFLQTLCEKKGFRYRYTIVEDENTCTLMAVPVVSTHRQFPVIRIQTLPVKK